MPRSSLPWLIAATVLVSAALAWWTLTRGAAGTRPVVSEHRALAPFHEIEIGGAAEITLLQGDSESIDVQAPGRGVRVDAEVSKGRLLVTARDRRRWWSGLFGRHAAPAAVVTVRFRTLDAVALTGNVRLIVPRLATPTLRIIASGGSTLSIDDIRATSLRVSGSGALQADMAGQVEQEHISISGAGSYRADRLHAMDATVSVSGVGNVLLHAERTLRASISGAGSIEYVGDPEVTRHVSGIGRVRRLPSNSAPPTRAGDQCPACSAAPVFLNSSGPPVSGSTSAWMPGMQRTSSTRQSRISASSIAATSCAVSYG
jgi:hypothetical protein